MCVLGLADELHPQHRLVVLHNRDERHARPTRAATFWEDAPNVFGGRDLSRGGTWLGVTRGGRIGLVTNFRAPAYLAQTEAQKGARPPSRGDLVRRWLLGDESPQRFVAHAREQRADIPGFTLIFGEVGRDLWCYQSHVDALAVLGPGLYGLSNHLLDTPWPKVERVKRGLASLMSGENPELGGAFDVLADRTEAPDDALPDTGVGLARERALSPVFIAGDTYGTRASTVFSISRHGSVWFEERRFGPRGVPSGRSTMGLTFEGLASMDPSLGR